MNKIILKTGILTLLVLCCLFFGCSDETSQSETIKITIQNNSGYKLYSVKAGGVSIGDIEIGTSQKKDIEPDELSYSVFFTIKSGISDINIKTVETKTYSSNVTVVIDDNTMVVPISGIQTGKSLFQYINDIQTGNIDYNDLTQGTLPNGTLADKLRYIAARVDHNVLYNIPIESDINFGSATDPNCETSGSNVVIHIFSSNPSDIKTISLNNLGVMFNVYKNVTLILSNIKIQGVSNNEWPMLFTRGGKIIKVFINGGEIINNTAVNGGGISIYNSKLIKTGGYIGGTDGGAKANHSGSNEGHAVLYCRDYVFWDRKLSLSYNEDITTDNLDIGWVYLKSY